ncbi:MAG TPA: hypothetical protein VHO24_00320 [Opitutaceae bacterium]|nr:hypothetical protein [Opitutaceae bacterium]
MQPLDPKIERLLYDELGPNEKLFWSGAPRPGRMGRRTLPIVLFGIPWTAFAVFWVAAASGFKRPDLAHGSGFFPLFGLPFVLVGIGLLSSPYWVMRKARRTVYAVTGDRAIILEGGFRGSISVRSFRADQLREIRRVQLADGSGDLILDQKFTTDSEGSRRTAETGFLGIPDVTAVEALLQAIQRKTKPLT